MIEHYEIKKEGKNKYVFFTSSNIEYQLVVKPSGIVFEDIDGFNINILELALNCDINTAIKDYKTIKTLVVFCVKISCKHDAVYMQIHNQPEKINNNKIERRGISRIKLWNRVIEKYFSNYIFLNNLILSPEKKSDILTLVLKKDSLYYKECITSFYRFCYKKMYKTIS